MPQQKKYFDIYAPVFYPASVLVVVFIGVTLWVGEPMEVIFEDIKNKITETSGWFLVLSVNIYLIFCLYLAFGKFGRIRIGGRDATPDFSLFGWFSMLFSAGMGIGLLFFSVAEPIFHYGNPPIEVANNIEKARNAMQFSFLHYGLHVWSAYALIGLGLAFFAFNKKLPLTIRSLFYPLLGNRIYGPIGHVIDTVAVISTLFGLATTLGLGVQQVSAGLNYIFGVPDDVGIQVLLILLITLAATVSVVLGLDKGVRVLSEWTIKLGVVFLILMLVLGPTLFIMNSFVQNTGYYFQKMIELGTWTETYTQTDWQNSWTVFYWAWWISWSPFVGMFIARVSRGRTISDFIIVVLFVPTLLTFLWFSVFGGSALHLELNGLADLTSAVNENFATALFAMLNEYPFSFITSLIGIIMITTFFITSSDSGSLVIDSITSGGKLDAPVGQRIFWALSEGAVAATLLIGGGLGALQTAAISTGLPVAALLIVICFSLYKGLKAELSDLQKEEKAEERVNYQQTINEIIIRRKINTEQKINGKD